MSVVVSLPLGRDPGRCAGSAEGRRPQLARPVRRTLGVGVDFAGNDDLFRAGFQYSALKKNGEIGKLQGS